MATDRIRRSRRAAIRTVLLAAALTPLGFARVTPGYAQGSKPVQVRIAFKGMTMTATLEDNPSARDFAAMLPLDDLTIDNYANDEKISYLPRKLSEEGSGPFRNERPGDLCYFAPWGNLAFFYAGYHWSAGLIRLGHVDGRFDALRVRGAFPLRIDPVS